MSKKLQFEVFVFIMAVVLIAHIAGLVGCDNKKAVADSPTDDINKKLTIGGGPPKLEIGQVWQAAIDPDPFESKDPAIRKIIGLKEGFVQYLRTDAGYGANELKQSMPEDSFRYWSPNLIEVSVEVPSIVTVPKESNILVPIETGPISDARPVWGKGDPPADWQAYFGNDNNSRMNYVQSQHIDRLTNQLWELRADMPADPNR